MSCTVTSAAVVLTAFALIAAWVALRTRDVEGWIGFGAYAVAAVLCWAVAGVVA